jgi:hypothetical protein
MGDVALLTTVGFEPAADFPGIPYERTHERLAPLANSPQAETWRQFGLAWNAVAFRHQACSEYDVAFRDLFDRLGSNAGGLERYRQQRDLYGCVVNACSVVESFYYAAHAVGALVDVSAFPIGTPQAQRDIDPGKTAKRYRLKYADDEFTAVLDSVIADPPWAELNLLRNVLVHRAAPGKAVHLTAGHVAPAIPDQLRLSDFHLANRDFDERLTRDCRSWVTRALRTLCLGLDDFTERQFT